MRKTAIITGALGAIGRELCSGFEKQGYEVYGIDIVEGKLLNVKTFKADIKNEKEIIKFYENIKSATVLVNNAAISKANEKLTQSSGERLSEIISTNLVGAMLMSKHFIAKNKGEDYGRIINISSTRYNQNEENWEAYGASKGGLVSFTNSLCVSLSNTKITVNAISPGYIECDDYESVTDIEHKDHPSGRVGKPKDVLTAALFLADEANDFVNGVNLVVDGGMVKRMFYK